ncbi:MAG: GNAT family N-acetyltransferase [Propionibacteriaceae bacterium]|jgi:ribosomal protein S18 acetylase RimI-like enzyme|nr:GNAT family N-acetyltransferase [Propionibacteriaceae bacterium]
MSEQVYRFRAATVDDRAWLTRLHDESYAELVTAVYDDHGRAWQQGFFSARLAHPVDIVIVLTDHTPVGAMYLDERAAEVAIESLEVRPEHQHQGAGSAALTWVQARAAATARPVTLRVHRANPRAYHLYERCGFHVVGETATHLIMSAPGKC